MMKLHLHLYTPFSLLITVSHALITGNIQIVGESLSSLGGIQYLPGSYVNTFPRWSVDFHGHDHDDDDATTCDASSKHIQLIPLEGTVSSDLEQHQYVDPTSNQELWWPSDLKTLQMRPSLDFFVKNGIPSLVMAGIQIRVPPESSMDGKEWRNFGRNSQPLASLWTSFQMAVEKGFRVETFYGRVMFETGSVGVGGDSKTSSDGVEYVMDWKNVAEEMNHHRNDDDNHDDAKEKELNGVAREERLFQSLKGTRRAVESMGELLANLDYASPLSEGMHIVSIPVNKEWWDLPELKEDEEGDGYKLVSVGTVESDVKDLLKMGNDVMIISGSSLLSVDVSKIAAGGQSDYIPNVYKPLYQ
mmetsp:Transcript_12192/g.22854  ORF Transcript_12192/g.22854 Transcript_12192/m.22854 type:complete len:359 (+) Transcript_12192:36-1112(+)